MKRLFGLVLAGLFLLGLFSAPAVAGGDSIRVMTRNQYLGGDLTPFFTAEEPGDFPDAAAEVLQQIALNNFPLRARRLATEVALTEPHVIALQEVFNYTINDANPGPPFVDHLAETLAAFAARGQSYKVAAMVVNFDLTIPFDVDEDGVLDSLHVLDRDVILVREGVNFTKLDGDFTSGGLCKVPIPLSDPVPVPVPPYIISTLESTPSEDGCNYTAVVQVPSPIGPGLIAIERGFVGVDVNVRGRNYRVVNTHLEQMEPYPTNPASQIFQFLQAVELAETLKFTTPPGLPLILLGDFNSSPEDEPFGPIDPPYQVIVDAGFADIWDTNRFVSFDPGYTCCQDDDLANRRSLLDERIDLIFVSDSSFLSYAFVVGRVPIFPLFWPPNWASDHGGVFAKLVFRDDTRDWWARRWWWRH
jgi:endonuclease/exonuclease/phosphatase family metal-dependent hydrolase